MEKECGVKLVRDITENWNIWVYRLFLYQSGSYIGPISDNPDVIEAWATDNGYILV